MEIPHSLFLRPFPPPFFDHLQYVIKTGGGTGLETRLVPPYVHSFHYWAGVKDSSADQISQNKNWKEESGKTASTEAKERHMRGMPCWKTLTLHAVLFIRTVGKDLCAMVVHLSARMYTQVTIHGLRVAAAAFNPIPTLELECSYRHTFIALCWL